MFGGFVDEVVFSNPRTHIKCCFCFGVLVIAMSESQLIRYLLTELRAKSVGVRPILANFSAHILEVCIFRHC